MTGLFGTSHVPGPETDHVPSFDRECAILLVQVKGGKFVMAK
jgi:hypothetical protein